MKLAAMEALYDGGEGVGLTLVPKIEVPNVLSFMATNDFNGYVPGINDLLNGYTTPDGKKEPSVEEKIEMGKQAITALAEYRKAKKAGADEATLAPYLKTIKQNMKYFGYGYVKDKKDVVPPIAVNRQLLGIPHHGGTGLCVHPLLPDNGTDFIQDSIHHHYHAQTAGHFWHSA